MRRCFLIKVRFIPIYNCPVFWDAFEWGLFRFWDNLRNFNPRKIKFLVIYWLKTSEPEKLWIVEIIWNNSAFLCSENFEKSPEFSLNLLSKKNGFLPRINSLVFLWVTIDAHYDLLMYHFRFIFYLVSVISALNDSEPKSYKRTSSDIFWLLKINPKITDVQSNRRYLHSVSYFLPATFKQIIWKGWISRNFKSFNFKPKLSFLRENHKNDNWGQFLDFYEFTLYMNF